MQATLYNQGGEQVGVIELNDYIFGIKPNIPLMHQYVLMQAANKRLGTHNTRGRGEVRGSTRKLYRQKGTGRARQGSIRAPHHTGGGAAHGPHPRSYRVKMLRKMRRLAVRSALSAQHAAEIIRFVDQLSFEQPRTKDAVAMLKAHGCEGKTLIVIDSKSEQNQIVQRSTNNLPYVKTLLASYVNVRDLLQYDHIILPQAAISVIETILGQRTRTVAAASEEE